MAHFCFIHASDLHFDTPFEGIGRLGPDVPEVLRDATLLAWDKLVQETINRGAAFLVLAGDIYDGTVRGIRAQGHFLRGLQRLSQAGIQVFMVNGNHDPVDEGWNAINQWPPGVTLFGTKQVQALPVLRDGQTLATIHGISYARRATTANLARQFKSRKTAGFKIGLLHCNLGKIKDHLPYSPCSFDDLRAANLDYWALGHIHRHQVLQDGDPWVVYAGSLQGRGHSSGEQGPKGAVVVEVEEEQVTKVEFVPLDVVRFAEFSVDTDDISEPGEALDKFKSAAKMLLKEAEGQVFLLRARLTGRGGASAPFSNRKMLDAMLGELRQAAHALAPSILWDSAIDERMPLVDLNAVAHRGDFSSEVLALVQKLEGNERSLDTFVRNHCEPPASQEFYGLPPVPDGMAAQKLLRQALAVSLEALEVDPQS